MWLVVFFSVASSNNSVWNIFIAEACYYTSAESTPTLMCNNGVFSFIVVLHLRSPIESKFSQVGYFMHYVGIHQVRRLVFDNLSKVSSAFKDQSLIALIHAWAEPHHAVKYVTSGLTLWNLITFISPFELAYKCTTTLWIWMPQPSCEFTSSNSRGKISQGVYNITPTHLIDLHLVRIDPDSNCQEGLTFFSGSGWPGDWLEIRF